MQCPHCNKMHSHNVWRCENCNREMTGGIVFVTGISGSGAAENVSNLHDYVNTCGCNHEMAIHDVGAIMRHFAERELRRVVWDRILDMDEDALAFLRALAFQAIQIEVQASPDKIHFVRSHLTFRWRAFMTRGIAPHLVEVFRPYIRCFINIQEDLKLVQESLKTTRWGERKLSELLVWRDEEVFLTSFLADICDQVDCFVVANREPANTIERLVWHPEVKKVYLSFPITNIRNSDNARHEIESFRDEIRKFLVVFDPYVSRDYEDTYIIKEMNELRGAIGDVTMDHDYRLIDQSDAIVVYFPLKVDSKGVDAEMNYAQQNGKPIFRYCPEELEGGPFQVPADHQTRDRNQYIRRLKDWAMSN